MSSDREQRQKVGTVESRDESEAERAVVDVFAAGLATAIKENYADAWEPFVQIYEGVLGGFAEAERVALEEEWLSDPEHDRLPSSTRTRRLRKKRFTTLRRHSSERLRSLARLDAKERRMELRRFSMLPQEEQARRINEDLEDARLGLVAEVRWLERKIAEAC